MEISRKNISLFVFKEEDKGSAEMVVIYNKRGYYGIIENVFVEPEYRGQGIARKLINEIKALAVTLDLYKIVLTCSQKLTSFYYNQGFEWQDDGQGYCMRIDMGGTDELRTIKK